MWRHTVQHEMLHALGFLHEMARPDRDDYVVVENVVLTIVSVAVGVLVVEPKG